LDGAADWKVQWVPGFQTSPGRPLRRASGSIPKGLYNSAQGCEERATLGGNGLEGQP
jgi:hypothetical protein